ncbi:hypothetical protein EU546_06720 [Candidatus Thorarchaeota archaeon]|nr:MAG: hypothetical protein EU546_06720 [Candidatus Thorarchaeota archaeon]
MYEERCPNTGLPPLECGCLDCIPSYHRFKFMGLETDCNSIEDIIAAIQAQIEYFESLKDEGYTIGGAIADDYMEVYPPKREGYYWGRCKNCGYHLELPIGEQQPSQCKHCGGAE